MLVILRDRGGRPWRPRRRIGRDGDLAEYMVLPSARYLVPIPDLDPVAAARLTDAALTSYHAIKRWLPSLRPGATAVIIGAAARFMVVPRLRPLLATHLTWHQSLVL
jgi:propanol-preferring alcohol dehydrogenase